jgi:hypothetical protein
MATLDCKPAITTVISNRNRTTGKDPQGRMSEQSAQFLKLLISKPPYLGSSHLNKQSNKCISSSIDQDCLAKAGAFQARFSILPG